MIVASNAMKSCSLPQNWYLAKTQPTAALVNRAVAVTVTATIIVLAKPETKLERDRTWV
jgi:hypothetical protein